MRFFCLIATEDRLWNMKKAFRMLQQQYGDAIQGSCYSLWDVCQKPDAYAAMMEEARGCQYAIVYFHGGAQILPDFRGFWKQITAWMPAYFESSLPDEIAELMPSSGVTPEEYRTVQSYFQYADADNFAAMFLAIASARFDMPCPVPPPKPPLSWGFYRPGGPIPREEEEAVLRGAAESGRPVVGLILHQSQVLNGNTKHIEAIIERLEALGAYPLPLFTRMANDEDDKQGIKYAMGEYFIWRGRKLPDVILVLAGFSLTQMGSPGDGNKVQDHSIFEEWDVPVLQVMNTRFSKEEYEVRPEGIDSMSLATTVFQPELDGQIITVPCATQELVEEDGITRKVWVPIPDRVDHLCKLALHWANLRYRKPEELKIAILFHNTPGNDKIGCAEGLDTFESVYRMVKQLEARGVLTTIPLQSGQDIANHLLSALTNDTRFLSPEIMMERAADRIHPDQWGQWFSSLSGRVQAQMADCWGEAPGTVLTEQGQLMIPGFLDGNIFIGLQPSRAFGERAAELYHSTDATPPYSYVGYYRWLEEVFGADVVYHIGTHGSLEWLPGKEVGLSSQCYPDICLGTVPNLYLYHIGITGEGIQAKRRSAAVILDHLIPSMEEAESYETLAVLDEALKEYYHAKQTRPVQLPQLGSRIYELAQETELLTDLCLTKEEFERDPDGAIGRIHVWMGELKQSAVRDGLHVFGETPKGKLYDNLMRLLVRVKNGSVPALNDSVLMALGYNASEIKDQPSTLFGPKTGQEVYEEAISRAREMVGQLAQEEYNPAAIAEVVKAQQFPGPVSDVKMVLRFLCETVKDKLDHTADEMKYCLAGNEGRFVPPSLGGNPTRGNVALLPTGRNFYASDPSQIPSRAAWEIGQQLAAQMLKHYQEEEGGYPESTAMVIWAGGTLKTCGEDFAEALMLMGVRPVYLGETTRVIGVEPIPLEELGRPRLDVTLRISGLFRDMYPNLIRLMDEAVKCVAALDESEDVNFIKKHMNADVRAMVESGMPEDRAVDQSLVRVYGCAPGGYGAGVSHLIESRQWTDYQDLAKVYETWSGHGYSAKAHGDVMTEMFRQRMSTVSMTIKNESTIEIDMLDSDDFYSYHGGLIACVKANSGKTPISLTGHSEDPERVKIRDTKRETARILRSKILNPKWLEGLKRHGFKGAQEISAALDALFGWDATAEVAQDWMYQGIAQRFLFDEETRKWMEQVNSWSVHAVSERLLEANQRGMWNASPETLDKIRAIYMKVEGTIEESSL